MTLEDFFTLTEMKNGLATLSRVEELISVMQRPVDIVITSIGGIGDAARQWLTVAGTLSATDNNDCLHHFVNLNGIYFLNQWLQEAMKCSNDAGDGSVEELMIALLGSLARLPIDKDKSTASGIHRTVECLRGHKNLGINNKAKELLDQWNSVRIVDTRGQDMDLSGASPSDIPKPAADEIKVKSSCAAVIPEGISSSKADGEDVGLKAGSAGDESEQSNATRYPDNTHKDRTVLASSFNSTDANDISTDMNSLASSLVSNSCQDNFPIAEESSICPAASIASTVTCGSIGKERNFDGQANASMLTNAADGTIEMDAVLSTRESSQKENCNTSSLDLSSQKPTSELVENPGLRKSGSCMPKLAVSQAREPVDCGSVKYIKDFKPHLPKASQSLSTKGISEKVAVDVLQTSYMLKGVVRSKGDAVNLEDSKPAESKLIFETDGALDMELESGEIDALEIARQVARKVKNEVVNYREPYCSSSPEICSSLEGSQDHLAVSDQDADGPPNGKLKGTSKSSENGISDLDKDVHDTESSMAVDKEPVSQSDNGRINFDLNAGFSTEDNNCSMNIDENPFVLPAPKPVVATSKITSGLPVTPLHFEGELGWKGSAATSAFHPAASRKTPDSERTSSGSKQKHKIIEIDLNAAGSEDDEVINQVSVKHPTGDSSIEVTSRSTERVFLDLNSSINNTIHQQIAVQSVSPSSSSSSRVPLMRDFDLNDPPSLFTVVGSQNFNKSPVVNTSRTCQSSILDNCDITTMSSRLIVVPQAYSDRTPQSLPTTAYGYNGFPSEPVMPVTALYRPRNIPYLESGGTPLVPRWLNSGASSSYSMVTIGEPSNMEEPRSSRPSLDLNSCMESSAQPGGSKQFYQFLGQHSTAAQPESSSGMATLKRKEPDSSGYETYPLDGKQVMSPW